MYANQDVEKKFGKIVFNLTKIQEFFNNFEEIRSKFYGFRHKKNNILNKLTEVFKNPKDAPMLPK